MCPLGTRSFPPQKTFTRGCFNRAGESDFPIQQGTVSKVIRTLQSEPRVPSEPPRGVRLNVDFWSASSGLPCQTTVVDNTPGPPGHIGPLVQEDPTLVLCGFQLAPKANRVLHSRVWGQPINATYGTYFRVTSSKLDRGLPGARH